MSIFPEDIDFQAGYVLPVDKPYGWTSADAVRKVKVLLRRRGLGKIKVGHAGTLDPLATGLLLVCIGKATRQAAELQEHEKEYVAEITLGATTPSYDLEHPVDAVYPTEHITREAVEKALRGFIGEQEQIPPVYSAKQIDGRRAYKYARAGEAVEMRAARIHIYDIVLEKLEMPRATVRIRCSRGTYIRSLARDLGLALDTGAHLTALRRTRSGDYRVEEAHTLEAVEEALRSAVPENESGSVQEPVPEPDAVR